MNGNPIPARLPGRELVRGPFVIEPALSRDRENVAGYQHPEELARRRHGRVIEYK